MWKDRKMICRQTFKYLKWMDRLLELLLNRNKNEKIQTIVKIKYF